MFRKEFLYSGFFLALFLGVSIVNSLFFNDSFNSTPYWQVPSENLQRYPDRYEGKLISSYVIIQSFQAQNETFVTVIATRGFQLCIPCNLGELRISDGFWFRGRSFLVSQNMILVSELQLANNFPIYYSIPGVLLFSLFFFSYFNVDIQHLAFIPRRKRNA